MVVRTRLRTALAALGLYLMAGLVTAYFGMHAVSGNRGLKAKEDLAAQMAELSSELARLRAERAEWERRVALLRPESLDPDMLDERARAALDYAHPRDLVLMRRPAADVVTGAVAAVR